MMGVFTVYKKTSGRILRNVCCPITETHIQFYENEGEGLLHEASDDRTQWVYDNLIVNRPLNPITFNQSTFVFSHVPLSTAITIENAVYIVNDGTLELELAYPGTYTAKIVCWPYLDKEVTFESPA